MKNSNSSDLLISVDLEDVRDQVDGGSQYREGVPENTHKYLDFLQSKNAGATFFVVGNVARKYPSLINEIISEGHEIACHSDKHIQINKQTPEEFTADIRRNLDSLYDAGAKEITGYRAPTFSLTAKTQWAYKILHKAGLKYSSSVLPAANPLYGWKEFGLEPKHVDQILEIPITLHTIPFLRVPVAGGVYFRIIPSVLVNYSVRQHMKKGTPITTYLHPYDIDIGQERFMHPDLDNKAYLNYLMYVNRSGVFSKLENLIELCKPRTYKEYYLSVAGNDQFKAAPEMES
jgi:polysaccharide deacetylase family protein (PEP-CTERM system associated)